MNEIWENTVSCPTKELIIKHKHVVVDIDFRRIEKYTFPRVTYQQLLSKGYRRIVVTHITVDDIILGTCISVPISKDTIQILSFYINEEYRNRGIGKQLLQSVISKIRESKFQHLKLYYKTFWPEADTWESVLKNVGYGIKSTGTEYIKVDNLLDLKSSKLMRMKFLSDHFQIINVDRQRIDQLEGWLSLSGLDDVPSDVRPGKHVFNICKPSSLLLLIDKQIAGWIVSDQISDDTIQVGSLYILPKYSKQYKHLGKTLIAELIRRNTQPYQVFFGIRNSNLFMKRFVERELGRSASVYYQKRAILKLNKD